MNISLEKKYYNWIDYVRFTCLLLVIFNHIPYREESFIETSLSFFRIPCFFFISGFLFQFEKYPYFKYFAKHRAIQILVPYFSFFAIAYIFWLFGIKRLYVSPENAYEIPFYQPLLEYLYGTPYIILRPLWFLSCLFVLQCLFHLIFKNIKDKKAALIVLILFPAIPTLVDLSDAPWTLNEVCKNIFFYGIGYYFKKELVCLLNNNIKYLAGIVFLFIHSILVYFINILSNDILIHYLSLIASLFIILLGCILIESISRFTGKIKVIHYISVNAVIVLAWHTYFIRLFQLIIIKMFPAIPESVLSDFSFKLPVSILIILLMTVPIYLINKYIPILIGKGKFWKKFDPSISA